MTPLTPPRPPVSIETARRAIKACQDLVAYLDSPPWLVAVDVAEIEGKTRLTVVVTEDGPDVLASIPTSVNGIEVWIGFDAVIH